MTKTAAADIVIFGGGIAGLWLLNRLRRTGLSVILFESGTLGGGQTHKAQGIIHGGMKYALQGVLTSAARSITAMPNLWRNCLNGTGEIDLSDVNVLSNYYALWSPSKMTAKLTGFLASSALSSDVKILTKTEYPEVFKHPDFKGEVYGVDELVLDVPSLIRELVKQNQDAVYKIEPLCGQELKFDEQNHLTSATVYHSGVALQVHAQQFIFTAGVGNEVIIQKLSQTDIAMQRRPLHMVMVKMPFSLPLYAHCLGLGVRPRLSVTTHYLHDGTAVWYLGGQLAEEGVERKQDNQIKAARKELTQLFPWLNFSKAEFATFVVDRAEPYQESGLKPDTAYYKSIENMVIGWPTKMVLAPQLASNIMEHLQAKQITSQCCDLRELRAWPMPPLARPVWEDAFCKSVA